MSETTIIDQLKVAGLQMYTALTMINALHHQAGEGDESVCVHCSTLADARVYYPCPTVRVLMDEVSLNQSSENAESQEPSA